MWERVLLLAALVIACVLGVAGAYGFVGKQFHGHNAAADVAAVRTQTNEQLTSDVAALVRTPVQRSERQAVARTKPVARTKAAATPEPPARTDCAALRGVHNRTRYERLWFIDNCMFLSLKKGQAPASRAAPTSTRARPATPSAGQPSASAVATPIPPQLTRGAAIASVVEWLRLSSTMDYGIGADDCTAVWLNDHWVVTCLFDLTGCAGSQCAGSISLCVFGSHPMIVPDSRC